MTRKEVTAVAIALLLTVTLAGCNFGNVLADVQTAVAAAAKISDGRMNELTADEILTLNNAIREFNSQVPQLTETQATGLVKLIQENDIKTVQDAEDVVRQAQDDPNSVTIPDELGGSIEALAALIENYENVG